MLSRNDILETIRMIDQQHLDIRTITMGISLLSCADSSAERACEKIYDKISRYAERLVATGEEIEREFGKQYFVSMDLQKKLFCEANIPLRQQESRLTNEYQKIMATAEIPFDGNLKVGHNVQIGYFAQNQAQLLDGELTVFETIDNVAKGDIRLRIKNILGSFMFGGEAIDKKVKVLSGGERSRLAMIRLLLEPVNLLILDEPTNHLDIQSKEVLKEAILAFDGTAIIVSHDREFLDGLVSKVYEFGGGKVKEHLGGIYDYLRSHNMESLNDLNATTVFAKTNPDDNKKKVDSAETSTDGSQPAKLSYAEHKEQQKKIRKAEKLVEESEKKISAMEDRLKELDTILCTPEGASDMTVVNEYTAIKQRMDEEEERWTLLSEELEELKAN